MKTTLLAVSISLLLCACGPDSSAAPETGPAAPDAAAPEAQSTPPVPVTDTSSTSTPPAVDPTSAASATAAPAANTSAADKAVNDSIDNNLGDHTRYQASSRTCRQQ